MESNGRATRFRHHPFIGKLNPNPETQSPQIELSEQEIFNSPSGNITTTNTSPKPHHYFPRPKPTSQTGLLAVLPGSIPGSTTRPVFNHKVSPSSTPPAISIPRSMSQEIRVGFRQSAPISVPIMSNAMRRNGKEFDDVEEVEEEGEGKGEEEGVMVPPHELVAERESPMFSNSMLEGVGRTLKGRDLRQVRNAVWRQTGFLD